MKYNRTVFAVLLFLASVFLGACGASSGKTFRACMSSMMDCVRATATDSEVCAEASHYEVWSDEVSEKWMREAISRRLECANTEKGRALAKQYYPSNGGYVGGGSSIYSTNSDNNDNSIYERAKQRHEKIIDSHNERRANSGCGMATCRLY